MCVPITSTPPTPQVRHRSSGVPNEFSLPLVEFSSTSGGCILIGCLDRDQAQPATQEGALFVSGARACARSSGHACTTRASHAARCTPTRALTRHVTRAHSTAAHSIALLARGRSLLLPSHLAGHFSARCWCQSVMPAAFDTYGSDCARWCCSIFSDRAQCSPFLSRRVLGAVA